MEKRKKNLITIYVYNKKQLAQAQSMGGVIFVLLTKKKTKLILQIAFYPSRIHDSTDYYSQISTIAMLPVFFFSSFKTITLGGEQRKGCKGGVHIPGSMTFLCQQQN